MGTTWLIKFNMKLEPYINDTLRRLKIGTARMILPCETNDTKIDSILLNKSRREATDFPAGRQDRRDHNQSACPSRLQRSYVPWETPYFHHGRRINVID